MKTSQTGIDLIKKYEGFRSKPYLCPAGIPTIGYGNTRYPNGRKVKLTDSPISKEDASELLKMSLGGYEKIVNTRLKVEVNQNQFDALVSHTFNTGGSKTLFSLVNAGADCKKWWTTTYITSNGTKLKGLVKRRKEEYKLFIS